jgi:hypothetical protein
VYLNIFLRIIDKQVTYCTVSPDYSYNCTYTDLYAFSLKRIIWKQSESPYHISKLGASYNIPPKFVLFVSLKKAISAFMFFVILTGVVYPLPFHQKHFPPLSIFILITFYVAASIPSPLIPSYLSPYFALLLFPYHAILTLWDFSACVQYIHYYLTWICTGLLLPKMESIPNCCPKCQLCLSLAL